MKTTSYTRTTEESEYEFTGEEIIRALVDVGKLPHDGNLTVTFRVPGGGDWSNTTIDVDAENPMRVQCKRIIES